MKKTTLLILVFVLLISVVNAERIFKQGESIDYKFICFNNESFCSDQTNCTVTILSPSVETVVENSQMGNDSKGIHNVTLTADQTNNVGDHEVFIECNDAGTMIKDESTFLITPSGTNPSTSQGIFYVILMVVAVLLFVGVVFFAWNIDGNNEYDLGGKVLKVNINKYVKLGLWFIAYELMVFISFITLEISKKFLYLGFASTLFDWLFWIFLIGQIPFFFIMIYSLVMKTLLDMRLQDLAKRNLKPR